MKAYILTIKDTGERYAYSSKAALFKAHAREVLGVSRQTIDNNRKKLLEKPYENRKITIELLFVRTASDIE
jgi:peroxiredoxin